MIRVRDNKTKPFKTMYPHSLPCPKKSDKKRYCFRNAKLKPEEKLTAIKRVRNGESVAGAARAVNVAESTLRGWCKIQDKIQFDVDRELFMRVTSSAGSTSSTSLDSFEKSPQQLDKQQDSVPFNTGLTQPTSTGSTQSTRPGYTAFNVSRQFRPWTPNPDASSNSPHSRSPVSTTTQNAFSAPETQELQSLMSWQYAKTDQSVGRMEGNSPTPSAGDVPLDLRLRPNPAVTPVGRMSDNFNNDGNTNRNITNNTTVATTVVANVPESVGKPEEKPKDYKNKKNTKKEDCDNTIDPFTAYRYARIIVNWFQACNNPTAEDFVKFQYLLGKVKEISQHVQHTPAESATSRENKTIEKKIFQ